MKIECNDNASIAIMAVAAAFVVIQFSRCGIAQRASRSWDALPSWWILSMTIPNCR